MTSIMSSKYWTCPHCFIQLEWKDGAVESHSISKCKKSMDKHREYLDKLKKKSKKKSKKDK